MFHEGECSRGALYFVGQFCGYIKLESCFPKSRGSCVIFHDFAMRRMVEIWAAITQNHTLPNDVELTVIPIYHLLSPSWVYSLPEIFTKKSFSTVWHIERFLSSLSGFHIKKLSYFLESPLRKSKPESFTQIPFQAEKLENICAINCGALSLPWFCNSIIISKKIRDKSRALGNTQDSLVFRQHCLAS